MTTTRAQGSGRDLVTFQDEGIESKLNYKLHILDKNNYTIWKRHTLNVLDAKNLLAAILSDGVVEPGKEKQARAILTSALDDENQMKVINCSTARAIWKRLEGTYENKTTFEAQNLLSKLHSYKIKSPSEVSLAIGQMENIVAKLRLLGEEVSDNALMASILTALPPSFKTFSAIWRGTPVSERNLDNLISRVLAEVEIEKNDEDETALLASKPEKKGRFGKFGRMAKRSFGKVPKMNKGKRSSNDEEKKQITCFYCNKPGHIQRNCYKKQREEGDVPQKDEKEDSGSTEEIKKASALMAATTMTSSTSWYADSGASAHITPRAEWLYDYESLERPIPITLGSSQVIKAYGFGKIRTTYGTMMRVLFVPDASSNLFSVNSAARHGIRAVTTADTMTFYRGSEVLFQATSSNGVYVIKFQIEMIGQRALSATTMTNWHQRFGHISMDQLRRMIELKAVEGLNVINEVREQCVDCIIGKCHRTCHPEKTTPKATKPGMVLHFDTVGPFPESYGGSKYFVLCKDEFSAYRLIKFIAVKSDIADDVKQCINQAEVETGNAVQKIVTDNGTEFVNKNLSEFLRTKGIIHSLSAPYTPQQNGLIERDIRTVSEAGKTMLHKSGLETEAWAEAMNTAVYVLNRSLSTRSEKTPHERWFGKKPNVNNLHVFGQTAYYLKPSYKLTKLGEKAQKALFVGYTDKYNTFRFLCPETKKIFISSDAVFLDFKFDNSQVKEERVTVEDAMDNDFDGGESSMEHRAEDSITEDEYDVFEFNDLKRLKKEHDYKVKSEGKSALKPNVKIEVKNENGAFELDDSFKDASEHVELDNELQVMNIPKSLYIGKHPPQIVSGRLRARSPPLDYDESKVVINLSTFEADDDPQSYDEAMGRDDHKKWLAAMNDEIQALKKYEVYTLVDRPKCNIVTNRWVLRIKRKPNGTIDRYRARLVARGFSQVYGLDYNETYAPVVNMVSVRMLFAYASIAQLEIGQFDVKTAFLYGDLEETIYMEQPEGFCEDKNKVCLLKKSLYGLKQAPRQWNKKFTEFLKNLNLVISTYDECIFYRENPLLIIAIYVDDGLVLARTKEEVEDTMKLLRQGFDINSVDPTSFLGFQIHRGAGGEITLYQESYVNKTLHRFNMEDSKPVDSPVTLSQPKEASDKALDAGTPYREAIGSLMYAVTTTRLDIAYAVGKLSRKVAEPTVADWVSVKRVLRYLNGCRELGLTYSKEANKGLIAYCDADFAGDTDTHRSTTGAVVLFGGAPIHWKSQRQSLVTTGSTEAEYVGICSTTKDLIWIRNLAMELGILEQAPTMLYSDNTSAIRIATNKKSIHRTRHMAVQFAYAREQVENKNIAIEHVKSDDQLADMLTKETTQVKFLKNRDLLMRSPKSSQSKSSRGSKMMLAMLCLASFAAPASGNYPFQRVKPIIYKPLDNYVETGSKEYVIDFTYMNPCDVIRLPPPPIGPGDNPMSYDHILWNMDAKMKQECEEAYEQSWLKSMNAWIALPKRKPAGASIDAVNLRKKRSITGLILFATCVTNLLATVVGLFHHSDESYRLRSLEEAMQRERESVRFFQQHVNIAHQVEKGIIENIKHLERNVQEQNKKIAMILELMPKSSWFTAVLHSRIVMSTLHLNRMIEESQRGRLATYEASIIFNMTDFQHVENRDTEFLEIRAITPSTVRISFSVNERAKDTHAYEVIGFRHWEALDKLPQLKEYVGGRYMILNTTSNCIKPIREPKIRGLRDECTESNFVDPRLNKWRLTIETKNVSEVDVVHVEQTSEYWYVYCYPKIIRIDRKSYRCATDVMRICIKNVIEVNNVTYKQEHVYREVKMVMPVIDKVHDGHFTSNDTLEELKFLDRINQLGALVDSYNRTEVITIEYVKLRQISYSTLIFLAIAIPIGVIVYLKFSNIKTFLLNERPAPATETVAEPLATHELHTYQ